MSFTVGSLFDGSGGFPLAAFMCEGVPLWASEVEPYPIAVTKSRFPYMKHLGDVTKVKGDEVEPVDVITFGSPCQDMSVAGKQAGLKHEDNGDDETTRSGLFMEAVRIIKEMREKTNGEYPRFAVWENVPGAFSSNKGEDLRIVLEELIKIVEPTAVMPSVPKNGWAYADCYSGDGWSLAYRVFDAQYIRTAQRRRRIYLVLDFRGQCAGKVLFEREGLRGYFAESRTPWEGTPADAERSAGTDDSAGNSVVGFDAYNQALTGNRSKCMTNKATDSDHIPCVVCKCYDARGNGDGKTVNTLIGDHNNRITDYTSVVVALEGNGQRPSHHGDGYRVSDKSYTLNTTEVHGVAYSFDPGASRDVGVLFIEERAKTLTNGTCPGHHDGVVISKPPHYIVRRLTPTECARLQGFPDKWGHPDRKTEFTDEEYEFWLAVHDTHLAINNKKPKVMNHDRLLRWYNKLHVDSSEYKMWGNGIALPCAVYVMEGIAEILN